MLLSVREIQKSDLELIVDYFLNADEEYLRNMGADKSKMPERAAWIKKISADIDKPYSQKTFYYIIWEIDLIPVGHSNINSIDFGTSAVMHLHIWQPNQREAGSGTELLKKTIPFYFSNFQLQTLICEPYAHNPAPNKTLPKIGFKYIRTYETTPGWINFEQEVNRYEMDKIEFEKMVIRYF